MVGPGQGVAGDRNKIAQAISLFYDPQIGGKRIGCGG
jgi:hypothetical protein